jgi:hypothetical protein
MHEPLRQRIAVQYHLEGFSREELDAYLAHQLKAAGVSQPWFDDTARQALYQASKGIPRKINKLARTALSLAAQREISSVMKPFCSTPPARLRYEYGRVREKCGVKCAVARPVAGATADDRACLVEPGLLPPRAFCS